MSLLVRSEIVAMFVSTLTADEKYFSPISEKLLQPVMMQLSKK